MTEVTNAEPAPVDVKSGVRFWRWATLGFVVLVSLQLAKFVIDKQWDPISEVISANSLADLDWAKWIEAANIIAMSLIGGAAAGASAYAIKYLRININSGHFQTSSTFKVREGDHHAGDKHFHAGDTHIHHVGAEKLEELLRRIEIASTARKPLSLSRQDMEDLRKLANDSLRRKVRRLEAVRTGLKARVNKSQAQLAIQKDLNSDLKRKFDEVSRELGARNRDLEEAIRRAETAANQYEMTDTELANAESFLNEVDELAQKIRLRKKSA